MWSYSHDLHLQGDAFLADTRIDADAVNTVTIKVKV